MGSAKSFQDLRRVEAHKSLAIIIIGDQMTNSLRVEEDSVLLSAISVRKYLEEQWWTSKNSKNRVVRPGKRRQKTATVLVKLSASARCKPVLKEAGCDVVMDYQEMRYSLLGLSAVFPGLLALFINLNRARSVSQLRMATRGRKRTSSKS